MIVFTIKRPSMCARIKRCSNTTAWPVFQTEFSYDISPNRLVSSSYLHSWSMSDRQTIHSKKCTLSFRAAWHRPSGRVAFIHPDGFIRRRALTLREPNGIELLAQQSIYDTSCARTRLSLPEGRDISYSSIAVYPTYSYLRITLPV